MCRRTLPGLKGPEPRSAGRKGRSSGHSLTIEVGEPRHQHPGSDPVLQREGAGHGRLQVLRAGRRQVRDAGVGERGVLPRQGRERVHGGGVQGWQGAEPGAREVQQAGLGHEAGRGEGRGGRGRPR